jgi:DNA primase
MARDDAFRDRIEAVRARAGIADVVGAAVKIGKGRAPRGKCPFHGSKSDSFALYPDKGTARCWGCGWNGDVIRFVADFYGLGFLEALERLEGEHGLDRLAPSPVRREKQARPVAQRDAVGSRTVGRYIWRSAKVDHGSVRVYLRSRGVPEAMLGDDRLADIRFHPAAPIAAWPCVIGRMGPVRYDRPPRGWPNAPAMVALVRRPPEDPRDGGEWRPVGVHVTYLAPGLGDKMVRRRQDGEAMAARKMMGSGRGCVVLGRYRPECGLYGGEGIETVLSGMALAGAGAEDLGLALLSLDNLQGFPKLWAKGVWPLFEIEPDPARPPAIAFPHDGPVTGLIDADMSPLKGPRHRETGAPIGLPVVERFGGPIVTRAISRAERVEICARLFVQAWRGAGCRHVDAVRPHMGQDFNDAVRERAA